MHFVRGIELDDFVVSYLESALWSETDGDNADEPFDNNWSIDHFSVQALNQAITDCDTFRQRAGSLLDNLSADSLGHDFWLTRNHHGAGFWDGDYDDRIGNELTVLSYEFGECYPYIGDDGRVHFDV